MTNCRLTGDVQVFSRCGKALGALLLAASACALPAHAASANGASANMASPEPTQGRVIQSAADYTVLPPHERVESENRILTERLDHLLPALMTEAGLDMWVVVNREYAEDPVYFTLVPQPSFAARRTTMLVFSRAADGTVERLAVNRYPLGGPYKVGVVGRRSRRAMESARCADRRPRPQADRHRCLPYLAGRGRLDPRVARAAGRSAAAGICRSSRVRRIARRALDRNTHAGRAGGVSAHRQHRARRHRRGVQRPRDHARRHDHRRGRLVHPRAFRVARSASVVHADGGSPARRPALSRRGLRRSLRRRGTDRGGRCFAH